MPKRRKSGRALRGGRHAPGPGAKPDVGPRASEESVFDMISRITRRVPESEWARVPADLSKNVGHHLYGVGRTSARAKKRKK